MLLKLFTRLSIPEINSLINSDIVLAKKTMAYEITKLVHGETETKKVVDSLTSLFETNCNSNDDMPIVEIVVNENNISLVELIVQSNFIPSKSEARRLINQNGLSLNGKKVTDVNEVINIDNLDQKEMIFKKGKKTFIKIKLQRITESYSLNS